MACFWKCVTSAIIFLSFTIGYSRADDLFNRPVLAIDLGSHSALIRSLATNSSGDFVVTGSVDRTVRIWSTRDGALIGTIWLPVGPELIGVVNAVAISPDGNEIAAGGYTDSLTEGGGTVYIFDRPSGTMIKRIILERSTDVKSLAFSRDGRYLASTFASLGLRVFDKNKEWGEVFRDEDYNDDSFGMAFSNDGRLATVTSELGGTIRLYDQTFKPIIKPTKISNSGRPRSIAFSQDGQTLAIGVVDTIVTVDLLDMRTLTLLPSPPITGLTTKLFGSYTVAWSKDGHTLFAGGDVYDSAGQRVLVAWSGQGFQEQHILAYCGDDGVTGIATTPDGKILYAAGSECLGALASNGSPVWAIPTQIADLSDLVDTLNISNDAKKIDFHLEGKDKSPLRFNVEDLSLTDRSTDDGSTLAPNRNGIRVDGWRDSDHPTLNGKDLEIKPRDKSRCLAVAKDAKHFYIGSSFYLTAYDPEGKIIWRHKTRVETRAVNASADGRILVAVYDDGTIRWHRADDGRELLVLQVFANRKDWVLWTPEGFFAASRHAQDALKWVTSHGPDKAATITSASAIPNLNRPDALPLVLTHLETERALGIADIVATRHFIQDATGAASPPGAVLHILAVGINHYGDKAGALGLEFAAQDAHDVAAKLSERESSVSNKKSGLYAAALPLYLYDDGASKSKIIDAFGAVQRNMERDNSGTDVAIVLIAGHGMVIPGKGFFLIVNGFDPSTPGTKVSTSISSQELHDSIAALAEHGRVLILLDACHSGSVGAVKPNATELKNSIVMANVTVLTASTATESAQEKKDWGHGAFTRVLLDAIDGGAGEGVISVSELEKYMRINLQKLTQGEQHLGVGMMFDDPIFVVGQ